MKRLVVLAGPNGAGKTTLATLIAEALRDIDPEDVLNPDQFTKALRDANPEGSEEDLRPLLWKEMERQRARRLAEGKSFALETNFTYPDKLALLDEARSLGYETLVVFIGLSSPQLAIGRVARRVAAGGHPIADDKVLKRWNGGLQALHEAVFKSDVLEVFDNSIDRDNDKALLPTESVFRFANGVLEKVGSHVPLYLLRWIAHYRLTEFLAYMTALGPPNLTPRPAGS